jgi:hypothetical protein
VVRAAHGRAPAADDFHPGLEPGPHHPSQASPSDRRHQPAGQAHLTQLQAWLASRGLAPYDPQQEPSSHKESDLARLSRVHGARFDLAFLKVMTARHRAGSKLAATELREGTLPEVRQLAQQLLAEQQSQITTMTAWTRAWSKADAKQSTARASGRSGDGRR